MRSPAECRVMLRTLKKNGSLVQTDIFAILDERSVADDTVVLTTGYRGKRMVS